MEARDVALVGRRCGVWLWGFVCGLLSRCRSAGHPLTHGRVRLPAGSSSTAPTGPSAERRVFAVFVRAFVFSCFLLGRAAGARLSRVRGVHKTSRRRRRRRRGGDLWHEARQTRGDAERGPEPVLHAPCDLESRVVGERAHTNTTQRLGAKRRPPHSAFAPACAPLTAPALSSISRTCEQRRPKR